MSAPTRRSVVRAGVWTVPVVVTAAAAPAFAGTGTTPPVTVDLNGVACKLPGAPNDWSYRMTLNFTNTTAAPLTVVVTAFSISGAPTSVFSPGTFTIDPGSHLEVFTVSSSNSANRDATITYTVNGQSVTSAIHFSSFHPC
jgi:hypothetical protein